MSDNTIISTVNKPTGPKPRPPLRRSAELYFRQSPTMPKKNTSFENIQKKNLEKESRNAKTQCSPSSMTPEEKALIINRSTPESLRLYPELSSDEDIQEHLHQSTPLNYNHRSNNSTRSSTSSPSQSSFNKSKYVPESRRPKAPVHPVNLASDNSGFGINFIISIFVILLAMLYYFTKSSSSVTHSCTTDMNSNMNNLQRLFPTQNESIWLSFKSGIDDVSSDHHKPAIFLLLAIHNETTSCLAKKVAEIASCALEGNGQTILTPEILENDIGKVFTLVKDQVERTKAAIFVDLLNIKPEAVKALHDICDSYNPLVEKAVYLITMRSELYEESESPEEFAEQQFRNKFSSIIDEDILAALIARITAGMVLPIRAEKNLPC